MHTDVDAREIMGKEDKTAEVADTTATGVVDTSTATQAETSEPTKRRTLRGKLINDKREKIIIFAKTSIVLWLCIVYFTITVHESFELANTLDYAPNEANYSGMRRMLSRSVMFYLRMLATGTTFGGFAVTRANTDQVLAELKGAHEALLYGSISHDIHTGFLQRDHIDPGQETLMLHNGCYLWSPASPFTKEQCEAYDDGIMNAGVC